MLLNLVLAKVQEKGLRIGVWGLGFFGPFRVDGFRFEDSKIGMRIEGQRFEVCVSGLSTSSGPIFEMKASNKKQNIEVRITRIVLLRVCLGAPDLKMRPDVASRSFTVAPT